MEVKFYALKDGKFTVYSSDDLYKVIMHNIMNRLNLEIVVVYDDNGKEKECKI